MNNEEIKNILKIEIDCDYKRISVDEIKILLDYITKLEKENKELNKVCELYANSLYYADLKRYKKENEKLKYIISCYRLAHSQDECETYNELSR